MRDIYCFSQSPPFTSLTGAYLVKICPEIRILARSEYAAAESSVRRILSSVWRHCTGDMSTVLPRCNTACCRLEGKSTARGVGNFSTPHLTGGMPLGEKSIVLTTPTRCCGRWKDGQVIRCGMARLWSLVYPVESWAMADHRGPERTSTSPFADI